MPTTRAAPPRLDDDRVLAGVMPEHCACSARSKREILTPVVRPNGAALVREAAGAR